MRAAELGLGVHEMKSYVAQDDVEQWVPLVDWLAGPGESRHPRRALAHEARAVPTAGAARRLPASASGRPRTGESAEVLVVPPPAALIGCRCRCAAARRGAVARATRYFFGLPAACAAALASEAAQESRTWSAQFL